MPKNIHWTQQKYRKGYQSVNRESNMATNDWINFGKDPIKIVQLESEDVWILQAAGVSITCS